MGTHASILNYFFQAGLVVKTVMFLLLFASVISWSLILQRAWYFKRKQQECSLFARRFWECTDLSKLFTDVDGYRYEKEGLAAIFHSGFKEFLRARKVNKLNTALIERIMQVTQAKEAAELEQHLPFFASVGSIAPYVGLFGTVWGIMTSFQALGQASQATIAMVAPGISEALVATALGLFTAIPAVIAYNRYSTKANSILERYEIFQNELVALIEQQSTEPAR